MPERPRADARSAGGGANAQLQFTITPSGRTVSGKSNQTFSEALTHNELILPTDCGSLGTCGKCRIRFLSPAPEPSSAGVRLLPAEDLSAGWRLACQQPIKANAVISSPTIALSHVGCLKPKASGLPQKTWRIVFIHRYRWNIWPTIVFLL